MKNTNKLILLSAMLVWAMLPATAFSITKEQQVDLRLLEAQKAYKIKDYSGAVKAFEAIEKLNVNMEAEYYFFYASAENNNGNAEKAFTLVNKYLEISGQNGQYYQQALALYLDAEEKKQEQKALGIMVAIPAGRIQSSSHPDLFNQKPVHTISVSTFHMSQTEVTFAQWDACVAAKGCSYIPSDNGWGRGSRPVINVSYDNVTQQFIPWLNKVTGNTYRLPSEDEWLYAAKAGSTSKYGWGDDIGSGRANCKGCGSQWDNSKTAPVKSFQANSFGLYDMYGNVWELTQECKFMRNYKGWNGIPKTDCGYRLLLGGGWRSKRIGFDARTSDTRADDRDIYFGFRLVQER